MWHSIRFVALVILGTALATAQHRGNDNPGMDEKRNPASMVEQGNPDTIDDSAVSYWQKKLQVSYAKEREEIQEIIKLLRFRRRQTERSELSRSAQNLRAVLGLWQERLRSTLTPANVMAFDSVVDVLPKAGDDAGTGSSGCDELRQILADDESRLAFWQAQLATTFSPLDRAQVQRVIDLLNAEIAALETQIQDCKTPLPLPHRDKNVVTQHNDNYRTGANLAETTLNKENVRTSFGKIFTRDVDGDIYAQPLYVQNVSIARHGSRNVVYVATENNSVYAFDADDTSTTAAALWHTNLGAAVKIPNNFMANSPCQCAIFNDIDFGGCRGTRGQKGGGYNIRETGITGTPVIDVGSQTLYVVALAQKKVLLRNQPLIDMTTCKLFRGNAPAVGLFLHALDLRTGLEQRTPVELAARVAGSGTGAVKLNGRSTLILNPKIQLQRPGLLLSKGVLYIALGSYADQDNYHGWVLAHDSKTLGLLGVYNTSRDGAASGIWQAGQGLAADDAGYVYLMTGNGSFNLWAPTGTNAGDSFLKLTLNRNAPTEVKLALVDWFAPSWTYNPTDCSGFPESGCLAGWDADQGSSGPLLVPGRDRIIGGGKLGYLYSLDTTNLGHLQQPKLDSLFLDVIVATDRDLPRDHDCHQEVVRNFNTSHIHGSPVYWDGTNGPMIYIWGEADFLKQFALDTWRNPHHYGSFLDDKHPRVGCPVAKSTQPAARGMAMPGGILSLSAHGGVDGILWATHPVSGDAVQQTVLGALDAFDAADVSNHLWSSTNHPRDALGAFGKFNPPTIANGKVFVGTFAINAEPARLVVYGLR
jgi:hypothetical protein